MEKSAPYKNPLLCKKYARLKSAPYKNPLPTKIRSYGIMQKICASQIGSLQKSAPMQKNLRVQNPLLLDR
jgi:hypothetical protein